MYKEILVAVDLEEEVDWASTLPAAIHQARAAKTGRLHVLTVVPDFGMSIVGQFFPRGYEKEVAEKVLARLKERVGACAPEDVPIQHIVGEGNVYETVLRVARQVEADLIVMGAHRPELSDYLLGPNAARVVRHAECSVLVVRP